MKTITRGAQRLRTALVLPKKKTMTQVELAKICKVSPQAVNNWVHGIARPSPEAMLILEQRLGISMKDWLRVAA